MKQKADGAGKLRFVEELGKSTLPALLSPYDAEARLTAAFKLRGGLYAGAEVLIAASAQTPSGGARRVPLDEARRIRGAADQFVIANVGGPSFTVSGLRTVRALRPPWFSAPVYGAILAPFDDELEASIGHRSGVLLTIATEISEMPPSVGSFPPRWSPLAEHLTVCHEEIGSPGDLWKAGFVEVGTTIIPLKYKIADATYRWICETLAERLPRFFDAKGESLERVVLSYLRSAFPRWEWVHSYEITVPRSGQEASRAPDENDIIGFENGVGLAVESKSLRFRPASGYWSALNADRDAKPIIHADRQILRALSLLANGGRIRHAGVDQTVPRMREVFGLIVTDEVFTPYVWDRDHEANLRTESDGRHGDTWKSAPTRLSIIDLALVGHLSQSPAVLLDFLGWYRETPRLSLVDIPEAWLLYGADPIVKVVEKGLPIVAEEPEWWNLARSIGWEGLKPPWVYRWELLNRLCEQKESLRALRVVRADRSAARRRFPNQLHLRNMPRLWRDYPDLLDARMYRKSESWDLQRFTPPIEESPRMPLENPDSEEA
jgi:hypothetical protein